MMSDPIDPDEYLADAQLPDPSDHTLASLWEAQAKLVYAVLVAGKSAKFAEGKLAALMEGTAEYPFEVILRHVNRDDVGDWLRRARTGSYGRLAKCLPALACVDVLNCSVRDLESIHGVGPKTARFYIMWTDPSARYAALDTHVLKWLRSLGYDAPKSTPQGGRRYDELEEAFLREADARGKTPRELDFEIWDSYAHPVEDGVG